MELIDSLLRYEIPAWHPLAVHFPIVLIISAAAVLILWSIRGATFWRRCGLLLLTLGMTGALFSYFTGDELEEQVEGTPIVDELVPLHKDMALYTLITTGVALVLLAAVSLWLERRTTLERDPPDPIPARVLVTLLVVAAAVLVAVTGHLGALMVWGR